MTAVIKLSRPSLDALAAGGADAAGLATLRSAQLSRHLLLLRLLVEQTPERDDVRPAIELLQEAQRADREAAELVLGYPYVGATLTAAIRRLRARDASPTSAGTLTAVAAAAGIRAGLDFTVRVPLPDSSDVLHLPTVGSARVRPGGPENPITVTRLHDRVTVGEVELPGDPELDGPGWQGLRSLDLSPGRTALDDLHAQRTPATVATADRLDPAEFERWRRLFREAVQRLSRRHDGWSWQTASLLRAVTPLPPGPPGHGISFTSRDAFGAICLTWPGDPELCCSTIVHELQHGKFNALLDVVRLVDDEGEQTEYAPWRDDPRPLTALTNGCYAFLGVTTFWAAEQTSDSGDQRRATYEYARAHLQVSRVIDTLSDSKGFTVDGRRFVAGMRTALEKLPDPAGPGPAYRIARLVSAEHHINWRLRNIRVDSRFTTAAAGAWRAGQPPPAIPPGAVAPGRDRFTEGARSRQWSAWGRRPEELASLPWPQASETPELVRAADQLLAVGDTAAAAERYRAALLLDPAADDAWVGLALARRSHADRDARVWRERPELPKAVCLALLDGDGEPPDPVELAGWLAVAVR
ncbi:aKG-HExxH-type peptide beta-hydroxylase [Actinoplanes sp. NPDC049599]|uniref:aKG-HExxH-type peptide beta-hydroxylase n=1 Tax=Actinoplanes sp. NPDC049599 TaxID=3363903 RepID=UPI0037AA9DD5